MTSEQRSCLTKVRHHSQLAACRALAKTLFFTHQERGALQVYLCRFCHGWHVGHVKAISAPMRYMRFSDQREKRVAGHRVSTPVSTNGMHEVTQPKTDEGASEVLLGCLPPGGRQGDAAMQSSTAMRELQAVAAGTASEGMSYADQ